LGLLGLGGIAVAGVVTIGLIVVRAQGVTSLGPWGVGALFLALVSGVAGLSIFALGATFNYLVTLFYQRPIRQGLFGESPIIPAFDKQFGWIGLLVLVVGIGIGAVALGLGINGWDITRLWLYLLGSAMSMLLGVHLMIYWILMRVLEELSVRVGLTGHEERN
jgi:hypothetical protein